MHLPEREAEPRNPAPQRFPASTASTVGARCATSIGMYGFIDILSTQAWKYLRAVFCEPGCNFLPIRLATHP